MNKSEAAVEALQSLSNDDAILGIVLFGSIARNELTTSSDIDALIVHEASKDAREIRTLLKEKARSHKGFRDINPIYFTLDTLREEARKNPSFAAHLADEGFVLHATPDFEKIESDIEAQPLTKSALRDELDRRLEQLQLFSDVRRFNGEYLPSLSHLYSISRAIVILKLLENRIHEYSWRRIFDAYARIRPELHEDLDRLASLRAYYEHVRDKSALPEDQLRITSSYIHQVIASLKAVADS